LAVGEQRETGDTTDARTSSSRDQHILGKGVHALGIGGYAGTGTANDVGCFVGEHKVWSLRPYKI
jgi:hypothetical protein